MEFASVKQRREQWPLILESALSLSDTVPGGVTCAVDTTYKPAVVEVACTPVDPCWEHKL